MLHGVGWHFVPDILRQHISPIFNSQVVYQNAGAGGRMNIKVHVTSDG